MSGDRKRGFLRPEEDNTVAQPQKWGLPDYTSDVNKQAKEFKGQFGNFFHLNGGGISYLIGLNLCALAAIQFIFADKYNGPITRALLYASKHVTALYVIQWVLICWFMGALGYHTLSLWPTLCMMVLMTLLTFAVHKVYLKSKQSLTDITQKTKRTA